ncbi:hypothetical protein TrLO_g269 [Triparma laevis f. longispina]|uniref:Uncharacterized protein n=1 Tax=Triparma laevis f. longispina TaxID=1714387 RepID=A0A9W7C672_9STRA|nr:hypothetical protein TrLO_g269 [Triparma laevis f. longispina]
MSNVTSLCSKTLMTKFLQACCFWLTFSSLFFNNLSVVGFQTPVGVTERASRGVQLSYKSPEDIELGGIGDDWRTFRAKLVAQEKLVEVAKRVHRRKVRRARPLQGNLKEVVRRGGNVNVGMGMQSAFGGSRVTFGGPVKPEELVVLHSNPLATGAKEITPGVFVGGSESLRSQVVKREFHGSNALFARGHSLWVPGQLERELDRGVWTVASASSNYILRHTKKGAEGEEDCLWRDIMQDLKSI